MLHYVNTLNVVMVNMSVTGNMVMKVDNFDEELQCQRCSPL